MHAFCRDLVNYFLAIKSAKREPSDISSIGVLHNDFMRLAHELMILSAFILPHVNRRDENSSLLYTYFDLSLLLRNQAQGFLSKSMVCHGL